MPIAALLQSLFSAVSRLPALQIALGAAALGIASHHAYFIHGERDAAVWTYFLLLLGTPSTLTALLFLFADAALQHAVAVAATATAAFLSALAISILVYRLYFHPRTSPAPPTCRC